jgi:hypothetical protein
MRLLFCGYLTEVPKQLAKRDRMIANHHLPGVATPIWRHGYLHVF